MNYLDKSKEELIEIIKELEEKVEFEQSIFQWSSVIKKYEEKLIAREKNLVNQNLAIIDLSQRTLLSEIDLQETMKTILKTAAETLFIERISIWKFEDEKFSPECLLYYEAGKSRFSKGKKSAAYSEHLKKAKDEKIIINKTVQSAEILPPEASSMLNVPVKIDGVTIGVVCFEQLKNEKPWELEDQAFCSMIADHLSIAFQSSERKKSEEKIKLSEKNYKELFDNSSELLYIQDTEGKIIDVNNTVIKKFGYNKEEICGKSIDFLMAPESQVHNYKNHIVDSVLRGEKVKTDLIFAKKGGETFPQSVIFRKGNYFGQEAIIANGRDISERYKAEILLRESEQRFKLLSESTTEGIALIEDDIIVDVNESYLRIFGYDKREEVIGHGIEKFVAPEELSFVKSIINSGNTNRYDTKCIRKDNSIVLVEAQGKAIPYYGRVARITTILDITQRKLSENNLKESEKRFKLFSELTFEGIVFTENDVIIDTNDQFVKMLGYSNKSEIIGLSFIENFVHPDDKRKTIDVFREDKMLNTEFRIKKKDGKIIIVETVGMNIDQKKGTIRVSICYDITERKEYQNNLQESERKLSTLIANLPGVAYRCKNDHYWTMEFISEGCFDLTEYKPQDFINNKTLNFSQIILHEDKEMIWNAIQNAINKRIPYQISYRIVTKTKKHKWVTEKGEGVFDPHGKLKSLEGFIYDITDQKHSEKQLKRSQEGYKSLVDLSPDGILIHVDGLVVFANPSALKILEIKELKDLQNKSILHYVLPKYHTIVEEAMRKGTDQPFVEVKMKIPNGKTIEAEVKAVSFMFQGKDAMQLVLHDTSAQKQLVKEQLRAQIAEESNKNLQEEIREKEKMQKKLLVSEERYRTIYSQAFIGIARVDLSGKFLEVNQELCNILGYSKEELIKLSFDDITHPENIEMNLSLQNRLIKREIEHITIETKYIHKKNSVISANLTVSLVKNVKNEPDYFISFFQDITERKEAESKIKQSLNEKEVLLKEVHHRVKNNLQVISSILNLQSSYVKDKNTLNLLKDSQNRIKSMSFIHESLYQAKNFSGVKFSDYISNLSTNLLHTYGSINPSIELDLRVENVFLNLDSAIPCGLIVNELVTNSLKYAFPGNKKGRILISIKQKKESIELKIADNGIGFPKGLDYRNTESLGLQLVVTLVDQLNADLIVSNSKGLSFTITFKAEIKNTKAKLERAAG